MPKELKKEEVEKELQGILESAKADVQKSKEANMSTQEKEALEQDKKEAEKIRIQAEEQAKKDAELIIKKDEEITNEQDKKRKFEILEEQRKKEDSKLSAEDKIKRIEEKTQKRIDELVNKLKEVTDKTSKEAQLMKQEVETLRKEKQGEQKEDILSIVEKEEAEKNKKYFEEDKTLSREKRREISDDEIDEWLLEDQKTAIAWIQRREFRREIDKRQNLAGKQKESLSKKLFVEQSNSYAKVLIKHPELNIQKRKDELKNQGKSDDEIEDILRSENKKYETIHKIAEENPIWKYAHNAPELAMEEMEKRLGDNKNEEKSIIEKLQEQVEALSAEIQKMTLTDIGINSNIPKDKNINTKLSSTEELIANTMRDKGATQMMIDTAIKKHREKKK